MSDFKNTEREVDELKEWRQKVVEVWSTTQMKQSKDEIYRQKNQWQRVAGIMITINIIFALLLTFKDELL